MKSNFLGAFLSSFEKLITIFLACLLPFQASLFKIVDNIERMSFPRASRICHLLQWKTSKDYICRASNLVVSVLGSRDSNGKWVSSIFQLLHFIACTWPFVTKLQANNHTNQDINGVRWNHTSRIKTLSAVLLMQAET